MNKDDSNTATDTGTITMSDGRTTRTLATGLSREDREQFLSMLLDELPGLKIVGHDLCPSWCEIDHDVDNWGTGAGGYPVRSHQGPKFGPFLVGAFQRLDGMDAPTVILGDLDGQELDAGQMLTFSAQAAEAAEWLAQNA